MLALTGLTTREEAERYPYRPSRIVESVADLVAEVHEGSRRAGHTYLNPAGLGLTMIDRFQGRQSGGGG